MFNKIIDSLKMATFYYNRNSHEDINSQWTKHLQANAYVGDIEGIVYQNQLEIQRTIQNASSGQIKAIQQVCGRLDDGIREVNQHLQDINFNISGLRGEINAMASMLDWKLSLIIEEQKVTNQLLGHIAQLLRIPDSQKQRVYHIEQGLKYLKNAILEGTKSSFYIDSLESFKEAEKIERKDYITLNRIGQIYLYSEKYRNFPLSEEYFLMSAREAFAESNVGGTTTSNNLTPSGHQPKIYSQNPFKAAAAEAYAYAGRTCYLQNKLTEAAELVGKAFDLVPEFNVAGFEHAKYLAANNQEIEAAKVLEKVINNDRYFSIKTLRDEDLASKQTILKLLENFRESAINKANTELEKCKVIMNPRSKAKPVIEVIENEIKKNNFLSGMKALDLLTTQQTLPYRGLKYGGLIQISDKEVPYNIYVFQTTPQDVLSFINCENEGIKHWIQSHRELTWLGDLIDYIYGKEAIRAKLEKGYWESMS